MERNRCLVANVRNCFQSTTAGCSRLFFEALIEHLANASSSIVRVDPNKMHVPRLRRTRSHKSKEESYHDAIVLNDARQGAQLIEEDGMGPGAGWTTPPPVDHLDNVLIILLS